MTSHCQIGQKAVVTLADGRVLEYTQNLPIDINCVEEFDECQQVTVSYSYTTRHTSTGALQTTNATTSQKAPIGGLRISSDKLKIDIYSRGGLGNCLSADWRNLVSISAFALREIISAQITNIATAARRRLTIKDSLGETLFSEIVSTCGYTVDCQEKCPPNSLECGDCCLDCASIVQQLRNARSQLLAITNHG
ncbi:MAG: hypothetical protein RMY29_014555 [Nostoc sp. CreGUA01]